MLLSYHEKSICKREKDPLKSYVSCFLFFIKSWLVETIGELPIRKMKGDCLTMFLLRVYHVIYESSIRQIAENVKVVTGSRTDRSNKVTSLFISVRLNLF